MSLALRSLVTRPAAAVSRIRLPVAICRFSSSPLSASASSSKDKPVSSGPRQPSILPAGTVMTGLSVLKDQPDPVALPDNQYPSWLWTILDEPAPAKEGEVNFQQEKKKLRATNKANIKAANYLKTT